ncbi:hypothetical protein OIV83_001229 [Microbotryomycetes sp. JL201]|nr:hypothetical protein OIV83_001229 [Microbotryomycetes sp. JL201]
MHTATVALVAAAIAQIAIGAPTTFSRVSDAFECGSVDPLDDSTESNIAKRVTELEQLVAAQKRQSNTNKHAVAQATGDRQVKVQWHKIVRDDTYAGGNYDDSAIDRQIEVLNERFGPSGFAFALESKETVYNESWFLKAGPGSPEETEMKTALRVGGADSLNFYSVGFRNISTPGLLGVAAFPSWYRGDPVTDGVMFRYESLPGGSLAPNYNLGMVNAHEAGHWLGLMHTFQGPLGNANGNEGTGCKHGDKVKDTPATAGPTFGCPTTVVESCKNAGIPMVDNLMDYTYDTCKSRITEGQSYRMQAQWDIYRAPRNNPF